MRNEENAVVGVGVALYDVTRFRLLDDAKTNLVATVSHEIRTPLTSVRMVLHLLLEKTMGPLTRRQNELLVTARDDAERLLRILNDLLDLTRLEQGNTGLRPEKIAPADLVQNVAETMRDAINARHLKLNCLIEPDLPPLLVDRQRINHVFANLINNAIKDLPPGGEIALRAARVTAVKSSSASQTMAPACRRTFRTASLTVSSASPARPRPAPALASPSPVKSSSRTAAASA